jgi:molecular chaperone IbpA
MTNLQLDPFWRTSIGFDRLLDLLDNNGAGGAEDKFPPYNIARTGEDTFRLTLAVAGFTPENITIIAHQNTLTVAGKADDPKSDVHYLYRGIAGRPFERRFNLADYVEVTNAGFENGLLEINLVRRVPEAMKPRRVEIGSGGVKGDNVKTITQPKAA